MGKTFVLDGDTCFHDKAEYIRLHDEMFKRMEWLFSHGYTLVSMVAVFWSITIAALATVLTSEGLPCPFDVVVPLFIVLLIGMPAVVVLPFSVKYQDNLRTVASLGAYLRVFHELPTMLKKDGCAKIEESGKKYAIFSWETLHCDTHYERTKGFGIEYTIIAVSAIALSACIGIGFFIFSIVEHFAVIKIIFLAVIFVVYWIVLILVTKRVKKNSCTEKTLSRFAGLYMDCYFDSAIKLKMMTEEEKEMYQKYIEEKDQLEKILLKNECKNKTK